MMPGSKIRRYRQSLKILSEACEFFTAQATVCNIILGDCLDGKAGSLKIQDRCLQEVFDLTVDKSDDKWHFVLGNHEYYCFDRESILEKLIPVSQRTNCSPSKLYYDFSPLPGFRFIVLDGYEVSIIGGSSTHHKEYADALLREKNHNYANGSNQWFLNMSTENFRYCPYNGAVSSSQLDWLCRTLEESLNSDEKCFVFCHEPIYVHCSHSNNLLWNCEDVLSLLQSYPNVIAFIAGHDHGGGFATDKSGIHHIIPPAPVECAEGEVAFGSFRIFSDRMDMLWAGKTPTKTVWPLSLPLRNGFKGN